MTLATPLLVQSMVSTASTSILMPPLVVPKPTSTTLLVIRVLHLMTQVCSIAHTFLSKWFVPLVRTPSSLRSALRPVMVLLLTHLLKVQTLAQVVCWSTRTVTTDVLLLRTSCDLISQGYCGGSS